jgi:hypothetical protein
VTLTYLKAPGRGSFDIFIDEIKVDTINASSSTLAWQSKWTSGTLDPGVQHTIRVVNKGNSLIDLDALQVFDTITPVGVGTYDDMDGSWSYTGPWSIYSGSGPYANTLHQNSVIDSTATVYFRGAKVTLTYLKAPGRGSFDVFIDNVWKATVDASSSSLAWQSKWISGSLDPEVQHTIRFVNKSNSLIDLDAIQVE